MNLFDWLRLGKIHPLSITIVVDDCSGVFIPHPASGRNIDAESTVGNYCTSTWSCSEFDLNQEQNDGRDTRTIVCVIHHHDNISFSTQQTSLFLLPPLQRCMIPGSLCSSSPRSFIEFSLLHFTSFNLPLRDLTPTTTTTTTTIVGNSGPLDVDRKLFFSRSVV